MGKFSSCLVRCGPIAHQHPLPQLLSYNATSQSACNAVNTVYTDYFSQKAVATGCGALASQGCGLVPTCKPSAGAYNGLGYPLDNDLCLSLTQPGLPGPKVRACSLLAMLSLYRSVLNALHQPFHLPPDM